MSFWADGFWASGFWSTGFWFETETGAPVLVAIRFYSPERDFNFFSQPRPELFKR